MSESSITTVSELIAVLATFDPGAPVRLATDSGVEFMDFTIGRVVVTPADSDSDCGLPNGSPVVRISTGSSYCCLPDSAAVALGWG